jgi:hypothetical protein
LPQTRDRGFPVSRPEAHFRQLTRYEGSQLKGGSGTLCHTGLKMTIRYAHLSQEHLKDSPNLLNEMPNGKEMENIASKTNEVENLFSNNLL